MLNQENFDQFQATAFVSCSSLIPTTRRCFWIPSPSLFCLPLYKHTDREGEQRSRKSHDPSEWHRSIIQSYSSASSVSLLASFISIDHQLINHQNRAVHLIHLTPLPLFAPLPPSSFPLSLFPFFFFHFPVFYPVFSLLLRCFLYFLPNKEITPKKLNFPLSISSDLTYLLCRLFMQG